MEKEILYITRQLNDHLAKELSRLQEEKNSRITLRIIKLADITSRFNGLLTTQVSDINAIVQNLMSK